MEVIDGKKRSRSLCNFFSCFGFAASPEASKSHKFRPKSETTPENSAVTTAAVAGSQPKAEVFEPAAKRSFLCWFLKREKKNKGEISKNRSHYHLRRADGGSQIKPPVWNSQVHQVAFKYKTRVEPAQVFRLHPASPGLCSHFASAAIVLLASECQETWLSRHGVSEPEPGPLMLIAMVLALLLVVSRITVITCVCAWLFFYPRLRAPTPRKNVTEKDKDLREDEENSKECKKMVVLRGLLERDRVRRLSAPKIAGAQGF